MTHHVRLILLITCAVLALQNARAGSDSPLLAGLRQQIEEATLAKDRESLEKIRQDLLAAASEDASSRAAYYAAYASFRLGYVATADPGQAENHIDQCVDELRVYIKNHADDAEAQALLGSCYGVSTRYNRLTMIRRGMAARKHMATARELAPENPWVMMQDGLADYSTPRLFGGDRELAITKLERSAQLFDAATAEGSGLAAWGAAETWMQLEKMYRESDRPEDARAAMANACERLPAPRSGACPLEPL